MVSEHARLAMKAGMHVRCSLSIHTPSQSHSPFARHSLSSTCITAAQHHMCPSSNRFIELMARFDLMPPAFQRVLHAHVEWCGLNRHTPRIASIIPRKPLPHTHTHARRTHARTHCSLADSNTHLSRTPFHIKRTQPHTVTGSFSCCCPFSWRCCQCHPSSHPAACAASTSSDQVRGLHVTPLDLSI